MSCWTPITKHHFGSVEISFVLLKFVICTVEISVLLKYMSWVELSWSLFYAMQFHYENFCAPSARSILYFINILSMRNRSKRTWNREQLICTIFVLYFTVVWIKISKFCAPSAAIHYLCLMHFFKQTACITNIFTKNACDSDMWQWHRGPPLAGRLRPPVCIASMRG